MSFTASSGDLWYQAGSSAKDFILLFQMGDTQSDWTGVTYELTTDITEDTDVTLLALSATNEVKTGGFSSIETDGRDNSTFEGYLSLTTSSCTCTIERIIERSEQTLDDGTVERIERGRNLKGTYYQSDNTGVIFTVELEQAVDKVVAVGLLIATTASMMLF